VLGALFRSTSYEQDKTELVFVVTPRLAKPLPEHYPLPTDHFGDASEANVYLTGHMEGEKRAAPAAGASAPAAAPAPAPVPVPAPAPSAAASVAVIPAAPETSDSHASQ
jgi:pilus assembly protein CpaC